MHTQYSVVGSLPNHSHLKMILSEHTKLRILSLWREGKGPTAIIHTLAIENMLVSRKSVSLFVAR